MLTTFLNGLSTPQQPLDFPRAQVIRMLRGDVYPRRRGDALAGRVVVQVAPHLRPRVAGGAGRAVGVGSGEYGRQG